MNIRIKHKSLLLTTVLILVFLAFSGSATLYGKVGSLEKMGEMVILENGRKKPLHTYALNILKQFSGRSNLSGISALEWLTALVITPEQTFDDKVFLVTNPDVLDSMGVPREGKARDRYSFSQLSPGLSKLRQSAIKASRLKDNDRTFVENEIIGLYNKLYVYQQLAATFNLFVPHADFNITEEGTLTLLNIEGKEGNVSLFLLLEKKDKMLQVLEGSKEKTPEEITAVEKEVATLAQRMEMWSRFYSDLPFTVFPTSHGAGNEKEEKWLSPWDILKPVVTGANAKIPQYAYLIRDFVNAYIAGDQEGFDNAVNAFNIYIRGQAGESVRPAAISTEVFYNKLDPFYKSNFFYGFAVLFLLLSFLVLKRWFYYIAFALLGASVLLHLAGVLLRMYIMFRPPVTNLYETFVFTGLIAALLGIILEFTGKKNIGILTGALAGLVMLMIAGKYALEGDTMGMLVAVLDSNFWLAFHVITIILGYAGVLLSGFIGHVYVVQRIFKPEKTEMLKNTFQSVYAIHAFGIIFTFLGTVLGGIWADQSWGRFWGWDPKENGALLILLWSAILFHAKLAGWIKENGFALGTVVGIITVALAWFGVNLLGVGLHSYGFTTGIAKSLFLFIVIEVLFIIGGAFFLKGRSTA